MKTGAKSSGKRHYKVRIIKEGQPKIRHLDYVWATSAREARRIMIDRRKRVGEKILKVKARALG